MRTRRRFFDFCRYAKHDNIAQAHWLGLDLSWWCQYGDTFLFRKGLEIFWKKFINKNWIPVFRSGSHKNSNAGWTDPLVRTNISMAFAWPANDTASKTLNKPTQQLSYTDSPLIFSYTLDTGLRAGTHPYNVSLWFSNSGFLRIDIMLDVLIFGNMTTIFSTDRDNLNHFCV